MWILMMNDMRSSNIEIIHAVCRADTKEELQELVEKEKVKYYKDGRWGKEFRKGGVLEWCNPPYTDAAYVDVGTKELWARCAERSFELEVMCLPHYSSGVTHEHKSH